MQSSPRVLVIAEAANPEWVSVPLIGWLLSRALAEVADVHVATQIRNRTAFLRAGLREGIDFTAIDSEHVEARSIDLANKLRMGQGKGWTTLQAFQSLTYPYFERLLWDTLGEDIVNKKYDIVHRITPMSPTSPSPIAARCEAAGVPFVLGPINGGLPWPKEFDTERRREREWLSYVRGAYKFLPGHKQTLDAARAIIVGSSYTASEIPQEYRHKSIEISESAVDLSRFSLPVKEGISEPLSACFIGRLVPYKGPDMLLEAAAPLLRSGKLRLDIIGDGPLMNDIKQIMAREDIEKAVELHGWVPHQQLQDIAIRSDIFTFPSIREFGGTSILETMALGLIPVIVDYGGPGDNIPDHVGFKLPLGSKQAIVDELRQVLTKISDNPAQLLDMRRRGREWIEQKYTWPQRAGQISEVYRWVLGERADRPQPFQWRTA